MTSAAWILVALAAVVALADWWAVSTRPSPAEAALKPLVMVLLIGAAVALDPSDGGQRAWFVVALVLSLAGDVFLLPSVDRFVPGLGSFLLAHVAFVVGFAVAGRGDWTVLGVAFVLGLLAPGALRVLRAVRRDHADLFPPVVLYIAVISTMVAAAYLHGESVGFLGAVLFAGSDTTLALDRFVERRAWMPVTVMVTYHLAQGLFVVSLVR